MAAKAHIFMFPVKYFENLDFYDEKLIKISLSEHFSHSDFY